MRRLIQILLLVGGLALVALAALPWWLGLALRPLAKAQGATFSRYERIGYTRFSLHDVVFARGPVKVTVDRIETATPAVWLLAAKHDVTATAWTVKISPSASPDAATGPAILSVPALHARLHQITSALAHWLPSAQLGAGEIQWQDQTLVLQRADWRDRKLTVDGLTWREFSGDVTSSWPAQGPVSIHFTVRDADFKIDWSGAGVQGTASFERQPLRFEARFPDNRWLPESADLTAENWELPAARLKLGTEYSTVRGRAHLAWSQDRFVISAQAAATPSDSASAVPPIEAQVEAQGDMRGATVTALRITAPFATADLSAPVALDYTGGFQAGAAQLTVQADLAKQPWVAARGQVRGVVGVGASGRQDFTLEGTGLEFRDLTLHRVAARGALQWPRLELTELDLQPNEPSRITARGTIDLVSREISGGTLQAQLSGGWFNRWLPAGARWDKAEIAATFSGPLATLDHAGKATVIGATFPALQILDLDASWRGRGPALDDFSVRAKTGDAMLEATGALDPKQLSLRSLSLTRAGQVPWTLAAPAGVGWSPGLKVGPLRLDHDDGFLSIAASDGPDGTWRLEAAQIESALIRDWIKLPGPDWRVNTVRTEGKFNEGSLEFTVQLNGQIVLPAQSADVRLLARGDAKGVQLDELSTTMGERVVTQASGHLPVVWKQTAPRLQVDWNAPLAIALHTSPDSPLWTLLSDFTGITVENPAADVELSGTLENPTAELRVKAARLAVTKGEFKDRIPEVTDLALEAHADRAGLAIDRFDAKIDEQTVQARGRLPTGRDDWEKLRQAPLAYLWNHGEGHIELADADLARLAKRAPDFMAAQGRLNARLELASGGALSGELHLRNAALRPIDPLGTVQEINADLLLRDRQLEIKSWSAKLGAEPVELRGTIDLPAGGRPRVALELQGKNLPLVRRTGLIVRSDLALKATTGPGDVTAVTGLVTLRDSVVLADLSVLRPTGKTTARRQPPYFSVELEPFRDWTLAVDLRGTRAVKIRAPVFSGVASARFRLGGTLGEPRAVGEFTIDEGRVLFPFATFQVQLGAVRLSEADPYSPQLSVNAQSHYHDYLLRLEASGPLESPQIVLSSIPSLESAQLLLMVTSGQSPETDQAAATGTQRLARLGTYLGQSLLLGSGGSEASRLELSSGSQVSRQGRETYEFTYRLDDRWALVGEYDEYDEYNAGVKWRAYVQEGTASEKKK